MYPDTPYYCMLPEKLVPFIASPFFLIASLYDTWQLPNILQVACMNSTNPNLSDCSPSEMIEINTFKTYTANALIKAQESRDWLRSVWAPSCPFHGNQHFGNDSESLRY